MLRRNACGFTYGFKTGLFHIVFVNICDRLCHCRGDLYTAFSFRRKTAQFNEKAVQIARRSEISVNLVRQERLVHTSETVVKICNFFLWEREDFWLVKAECFKHIRAGLSWWFYPMRIPGFVRWIILMRTAGRDKECGVRFYYMFLSVHYKYAAAFCTIKSLGIIVTFVAFNMILHSFSPTLTKKTGRLLSLLIIG